MSQHINQTTAAAFVMFPGHQESLMTSSSPLNYFFLGLRRRTMHLFLKRYLFEREFPQESH